MKDEDNNYDAKGKRWKSSKDHDYGDDDQEDVAVYCCWCCKVYVVCVNEIEILY